MDKLIDKIVLEMKSSDSLTDDEEIIRAGLEILLSKAFFTAVIAIIGVIMNCFFESIIFTVSFSVPGIFSSPISHPLGYYSAVKIVIFNQIYKNKFVWVYKF